MHAKITIGNQPLGVTIDQFCNWAGISKPTFYRLVERGELKAHKIGRRTIIKRDEAIRWAEELRLLDKESA